MKHIVSSCLCDEIQRRWVGTALFQLSGPSVDQPRGDPAGQRLGFQTVPAATFGTATLAQRAIRSFNIPVYFEPNLGQLPPEVRFAGHGLGYGVTLQDGEVDLTWTEPRPGERGRAPAAGMSPAAATTLRMAFAGANAGVR